MCIRVTKVKTLFVSSSENIMVLAGSDVREIIETNTTFSISKLHVSKSYILISNTIFYALFLYYWVI